MVARRLDVALERRAQEVFQDALDIPSPHRDEYITRAAGTDEKLLDRVRSLVASYEQTQTHFIDEPFISSEHLGEALDSLRAQSIPKIDRYDVIECIGAGGMGIVYEAEQRSPRRRVALKLLRTRRHSPAFLQRFQSEVEILGRLNHGSIAQVYEAGTHVQDGVRLPYYVMELVEGSTDCVAYCDRENLTIEQRLRIFRDACEGIQFGHMRGVVHLDLKPSNVLIDALGRVKIIDFGIAKATSLDVPDDRRVAGTPAYMSPEQRAGRPEMIDARSDVYSLGCLLADFVPEPMPHDLQLVRSHATAEHPTARYQTVQALADDISMFLEQRPVSVRRPPLRYRANRLWARRPFAMTLLTIGCVILTALVILTAVLAFDNARTSTLANERADVAQAALFRTQLTLASQRLAAGDKRGTREALQQLESNPPAAQLLARLSNPTGQSWDLGGSIGVDSPIRDITIRSDGSMFALARNRLTKLNTEATSHPVRVQQPGRPLAVCLNSDLMLARTYGGEFDDVDEIVLYDLRSEQTQIIATDVEYARAAAFSPCGTWCAASFYDGSASRTILIETSTGATREFDIGPLMMVFNSDGTMIASVGRESIEIVDTLTGATLRSLPRPPGVTDIEFSPVANDLYIATGAQIEIWNADTGERQREIELPASSVSLNEDATRLVASVENSVLVIDEEKGDVLTQWHGLPRAITSVAFDDTHVWAGDAFGFLWRWSHTETPDAPRAAASASDSRGEAVAFVGLGLPQWILHWRRGNEASKTQVYEPKAGISDIPTGIALRGGRAAVGFGLGDFRIYEMTGSDTREIATFNVRASMAPLENQYVTWSDVLFADEGRVLIVMAYVRAGVSETAAFDIESERMLWARQDSFAMSDAIELAESGSLALVSPRRAVVVDPRSGTELQSVQFTESAIFGEAHPHRPLVAICFDRERLEVWDFSGPPSRLWRSSPLGAPLASIWWDESGTTLFGVTTTGTLSAHTLDDPEPLYARVPLSDRPIAVERVFLLHDSLWIDQRMNRLMRIPLSSDIDPVGPATVSDSRLDPYEGIESQTLDRSGP